MFLLPMVLYLGARGDRLAAWQRWGLWAFVAFFTAACAVSFVGAMWNIIDTAR